tara:strand:- start:374 stop:676 length:303 start_codon:yes stop_codon:yes gene_type:complete
MVNFSLGITVKGVAVPSHIVPKPGKYDIVLVIHYLLGVDKALSHLVSEKRRLKEHGYNSLAIVLDTRPKLSYIVYVAGKGSTVKPSPFWISNLCLESISE